MIPKHIVERLALNTGEALSLFTDSPKKSMLAGNYSGSHEMTFQTGGLSVILRPVSII